MHEFSFLSASAFRLLLGGMLLLGLLCTGIFFLSWHVSRYYQARNDPNFLLSKKVLQTAQIVDSLQAEIAGNNEYIQSLYTALGEGVHVAVGAPDDVEYSLGVAEKNEASLLATMGHDKKENTVSLPHFFSPITGYVTDRFNAKIGHFGVDIVVKNDEPVRAMGDGTVIFSSWTQDGGYVLAIQHYNHFVSVYKHNRRLLKPFGAYVSAGEPISFMGNTGALTTGPHVHLELWWKGIPLNPELFVDF